MANGSIFLSGKSLLDGSATAGDILKGKTAYAKNVREKLTGTLELTGTSTEEEVLIGTDFYSKDPKVKKSGTMANHANWGATINPGGSISVPKGFHNGEGTLTATNPGNVIPIGYKLMSGVLVGIPGSSSNNSDARGFSVPVGCIPLILTMEGSGIFTGKGETSKLIIKVYDNLGNNLFFTERTSAGYIGTGRIAISPMHIYGNNIESMKSITAIYQHLYNQDKGLISDYSCGALTVTTWLQKY